jgi:hypothetical protein
MSFVARTLGERDFVGYLIVVDEWMACLLTLGVEI